MRAQVSFTIIPHRVVAWEFMLAFAWWLLFSENFRVSGLGGGARGRHVHRCVGSKGDRGQAKFGAASLGAKLQGEVLFAKRGALPRRNRQAKKHRVPVDYQRHLGA